MPAKIRHLEGKYKTISFRLVQLCDDSELRLYLFLKFHAIEKHDCFPAMGSIVETLGWSRMKLLRTLERMETDKRLKVIRSHRKQNVYDITWYDSENERGFIHTPPKVESRNETQQSLETRLNRVSKRDSNYKELNDKELNNRRRSVDKVRIDRGIEPIGAIIQRKQKS